MLLSEWKERAAPHTREQEMLHYQWFADMGNMDAARVVGKMLSSGGSHNSDQALRYFRSPPLPPHTPGEGTRLTFLSPHRRFIAA